MADPSARFKKHLGKVVHDFGIHEHVVKNGSDSTRLNLHFTKVRVYNKNGQRKDGVSGMSHESAVVDDDKPKGFSGNEWHGYVPPLGYTHEDYELSAEHADPIWVVEGELAVDVLQPLNPDVTFVSFGNRTPTPEAAQAAAGRHVVVFSDSDSNGIAPKAQTQADVFVETADSVTLVALSDVFDEHNLGLDDFFAQYAEDPDDWEHWGGGLNKEGEALLAKLLDRDPYVRPAPPERLEPPKGNATAGEMVVSDDGLTETTTFDAFSIAITLPYTLRGKVLADIEVFDSNGDILWFEQDQNVTTSKTASSIAEAVGLSLGYRSKRDYKPYAQQVRSLLFKVYRRHGEESVKATRFSAEDIETAKQEWLIRDELPLGEVSMLAGGKGSSKSAVALVQSLVVITGKSIGGFVADETGPVIWITWEASRGELRGRMKFLCNAYDIDYETEVMPNFLFLEPGEPLAVAQRALHKQVAGSEPALYVFDALAGADGSALKFPDSVMKTFAAIRKLGATALLIHHVTKEDANYAVEQIDPYGSVFIANQSRSIMVTKEIRVIEHDDHVERFVERYQSYINTAAPVPKYLLVFSWFRGDSKLLVERREATDADKGRRERPTQAKNTEDKVLKAVAENDVEFGEASELHGIRGLKGKKLDTIKRAVRVNRSKGWLDDEYPLRLTEAGRSRAQGKRWLPTEAEAGEEK